MTWVPYLLTGSAAALLTGFAPRALGPGVLPWQAYLVQSGVAVGGGFLLANMPGMLRPAHGLVFFVVSGGVILADIVKRYLLPATGLAAYPYESHAALSEMGQEPYYPPSLSAEAEEAISAYPYELGAYEATPGVLAPFEKDYGYATAEHMI